MAPAHLWWHLRPCNPEGFPWLSPSRATRRVARRISSSLERANNLAYLAESFRAFVVETGPAQGLPPLYRKPVIPFSSDRAPKGNASRTPKRGNEKQKP